MWCTMDRTQTKPKKRRPEGPVRLSVSLAREDYRELEEISRDKRVSVAWVVRDAVATYLESRNPLFRPVKGDGSPP